MSPETGTLTSEGERALAGRVAGVLWLLAAVSLVVPLAVPGGFTDHWPGVAALAAVSAAWGLACLRIDFTRAGPGLFYVTTLIAFVVVGAAVAMTGGSDSPAWILLFYIAAFCGYFFAPRTALPYLAGCAAVHALPFFYDDRAVDDDLADFLLAAPAFLVVGGVVVIGKRRLERLRREAFELSVRDSLTGLANRRALMSRVGAIGGDRESDATGLLMVDLDDFKDVNTRHGHPAGDSALRAAADALRRSARAEDLVARLGGDEFAIVVDTATPESMRQLGARVRTALGQAGTDLALPGCPLTGSAGWALFPADARDGEALVRAADISLRKAKALGKDRVSGACDEVARPPDAAA